MGFAKYPELTERKKIAAPPVPLLMPAPKSPYLPPWQRRSVGPGRYRIDPGQFNVPILL
jgi:hypothetical protein